MLSGVSSLETEEFIDLFGFRIEKHYHTIPFHLFHNARCEFQLVGCKAVSPFVTTKDVWLFNCYIAAIHKVYLQDFASV